MSRFQALTSAVLDAELDRLRARLGLDPNQKAELLREMAIIADWVARQAEFGRTIEARRWCIRPWSDCESRWSGRWACGWR